MNALTPTQATDLNAAGCFPFQLGLAPRTVAPLQRIAKAHRFKTKGYPPEFEVAMLAIKFALANPDAFAKWTRAVIRYAHSEWINEQTRAGDLAAAPWKIKKHPANWLPFER